MLFLRLGEVNGDIDSYKTVSLFHRDYLIYRGVSNGPRAKPLRVAGENKLPAIPAPSRRTRSPQHCRQSRLSIRERNCLRGRQCRLYEYEVHIRAPRRRRVTVVGRAEEAPKRRQTPTEPTL